MFITFKAIIIYKYVHRLVSAQAHGILGIVARIITEYQYTGSFISLLVLARMLRAPTWIPPGNDLATVKKTDMFVSVFLVHK